MGTRKSDMILTKEQNYAAVEAGLWGNRVRQWPSLVDWKTWYHNQPHEDTNNNKKTYMIRSRTPGEEVVIRCRGHVHIQNGPIEAFDMHYYMWKIDDWIWKDYYVNECIDNSSVVLNAEVVLGPRGIDVMYSTYAGTMREAMLNDWRRATGMAAKLLLQSTLCDNGYARLNEILEDYPGHIVELTVCSKPVGMLGWRTMIWEVRAY